jgi:GGDEF domain-containing protein
MPVLTRPAATLPAEQLQGTSTPAEAFKAALDETWATGPTGALVTAADIDEAEHGSSEYAGEVFMATRVGGVVPKAPRLSPRLSVDAAKQRVAEAGLEGHIPLDRYPQGIREETLGLLIQLNKDKVRRQTLSAEYDGYTPGIAGMVIGSLIDPANVATSFIPVVGEARYAQLLARAGGLAGRTGVRAGVGGLEGAVGAALVEPAIYAGQQQWRSDYDAYDSMLNIAGGAGFGAFLHGGAGMVKDAFGRPVGIDASVNTPASRQPFADPDVYAADAFKAKARAQGVSEQAIAALTPQAPRDDVTGFFDGRQAGIKAGTVQRALDHVAATGEPAYYVSADIYNLGGLNAAMGNVAEAANVHYRAMAGILRDELAKTGADVVPLRTGGDELGAVVVNADAQAVADAMAAVDARVAEYAQREGLAAIPHPKRSGEQGVGLHSGAAPIAKGLTIDDILRHADEGIDASKRGIDRVRRNEAPTHGTGPDTGGGAGRLSGEAPGGVRGEITDVAVATRAGAGSTEQRLIADLPRRAQSLREDLPRFERDAAESAEQARLRRNDKTAQRYAREQKAALDRLRADIARAEAGTLDPEALRIAREVDAQADPFATVRPFVADLEPEVQAAALRSAVAQMAEGRPIDVTPTLLAEADYPAAVQRAMANAETVAAADPIAARQADERLQQGEPAEQLAAVRELLADTKERLGERAGELEWESDLKTQRDAVKAATLCMMRNA